MQVFNKIIYSCSSDHTARAWLKDVGELLQVYKGHDMPISRVVYHKGLGQCVALILPLLTILASCCELPETRTARYAEVFHDILRRILRDSSRTFLVIVRCLDHRNACFALILRNFNVHF